jgi:hypothetical protein
VETKVGGKQNKKKIKQPIKASGYTANSRTGIEGNRLRDEEGVTIDR